MGQTIEIRQAGSAKDRPKWFKGRVRRIASENDNVHDMTGGAELEALEADESATNGNKRPLLILNRAQQVRDPTHSKGYKVDSRSFAQRLPLPLI